LDGVPTGVRDEILHRVGQVPGVQEVERVRVRRSGPEAFADLALKIGRDTPLERAHEIAARAEFTVRQVLPGADVVVQVNPVRALDEDLLTNVRVLAARHGLGAHGIRIYSGAQQHSLELHLEVNDSLSIEAAHAQADAFEKELREALPDIERIITHLEPIGDASAARRAKRGEEAEVMKVLKTLPAELGLDFQPHAVQMHHTDGEVAISFHCVVRADTAITDAHALSEKIEQALRAQLPQLGRVVIHVEPPNAVDE
jgi:divalent metal cation (Fe/Co/Zn/Cd) transporter